MKPAFYFSTPSNSITILFCRDKNLLLLTFQIRQPHSAMCWKFSYETDLAEP